MKKRDTAKAKDEQRRSALTEWDNDGGAGPSHQAIAAETDRQESGARDARRAAFDTTHDSSIRGEHRYADAHQTEAEQKARHDRDALKRRLGNPR
jgi:hypothetical protein